MRIAWRLSITLLALQHSRGKKASLAKLHVLNDALRSDQSRRKLSGMLDGSIALISWRVRVESAFSRNLDFMVGESLADWLVAGDRTSLKLTKKGQDAAQVLDDENDLLTSERLFISSTVPLLTERFVQRVLIAAKERV